MPKVNSRRSTNSNEWAARGVGQLLFLCVRLDVFCNFALILFKSCLIKLK